MKFEVGKTWVARDGSLWRILAVDRPNASDYHVVAMSLSSGWLETFSNYGRVKKDDTDSHDLLREHREPREWTVCAYCACDKHADNPTIKLGETVRVREILEPEK